jgi:hypothetical protein
MYRRLVLLAGIVAAAMILGGLAGCRSMPDEPEPTAVLSPEQITTIAGPFDRTVAAWITDDWLVVQLSDPEKAAAFSNELWKLHPDGTDLQKLDLDEGAECLRKAFQNPFHLPDGRLGYIEVCESPVDGNYYRYMMAYDFQTGETEQIMSVAVPHIGTGGWFQGWNPDMTRAIAPIFEHELTNHLYWFTANDSQPLNLGFATDFGSAWSPDGSAIAFWASSSEVTRENHTVAHSLYVMDPNGSNVRMLAEGPFFEVVNVVWSPDNEWLAFTAATSASSVQTPEYGVWFLERATGQLHLVVNESIRVFGWSPDGTHLVGVRFIGPLVPNDEEVVTIDLSSILSQLIAESE